MISEQDLQLNIVRAYISHLKKTYPNESDGAGRLLLVLGVYEWSLGRYANRNALTFDQLQAVKTGVREAELLMQDLYENEPEQMAGWYLGCNPANEAQEMNSLLWEIVLYFTLEIQANEALFPELKFAFDRERAQYRAMLAQAREAESL